MGAYTDQFWLICGWQLLKKLLSGFNKNVLEGKINAVVNAVIYFLDMVVFIGFTPFRDNIVNLSSILTSISNFCAIMIAVLLLTAPDGYLPEWLTGDLVMWLTVAGTGVSTVSALLDPLFQLAGVTVQVTGRISSVGKSCLGGGFNTTGMQKKSHISP